MKQFFLLVFGILVAITNGFAQKSTGSIKGTVTTSDGKPAESVSVQIAGKRRGDITNEKGVFEILKLQPGSYTLTISFTGYEALEQQVEVVANQTATVSFQLKASNKELQEVVVTSGQNKFAKRSSGYVARLPLGNLENPQVYNVVPKELLQEQMIVSFDDALKNAPGVDRLWTSTGRAGDGAGYFTMRGFSVQPTMINGIAGLTNGGLDPANIERIETIKGPSGTLFGSSLISFGGLMNIVTKKPYDSTGGEVSYTGGSYGLSRFTVDVNTPLNKSNTAQFRLNGAYHYEGSFQDAGFKRSIFVAPSLAYQVNDRLSFLFNTEFFTSEGTNPLMVFLNRTRQLEYRTPKELGMDYKRSFTSNDITIKNPTLNLYGQMNYKLSDQWVSQTSVSRSVRQSDGYYQYVMFNTPNGGDTLLNRFVSNQNGVGTSTDIQQNFIGDFKIGKLRNRVVAGIDFFSVQTQNNSSAYITFDQVSSTRLNDTRYGQLSQAAVDAKLGQNTAPTKSWTNAQTYSAYISDVLNITEQLAAMASVRIDYFDSKGSFNATSGSTPLPNSKYNQTSVSPKFGLSYQIVPDRVSVFGNYMNGFRNVAPVNQPTDKVSGVFDPQHANQLEGGVKLDLFSHKLSISASYYDITVDNMTRSETVEIDGEQLNITVQDGSQESKGIEMDAVANPLPGLNIVAGYSYNDSRNKKTDINIIDRRPNSAGPRNLANAWISYTLLKGSAKGLGVGFGGNYASENIITNSLPTGEFVIPEYTVLNATLFYNAKAFRVGVKVDNLTNEQYYKGWSTVEPQMPRRVSASVAFKF
ncbi:TonB-dependent receptor [Longitalea luteola]|uniref:TonB-dependent receptor n=1 Tax=Longitalea luteola TaxID=2812563 RepID=UPI001A966D3C|nr:TonB-dependent receptor [Longitalea luteola]